MALFDRLGIDHSFSSDQRVTLGHHIYGVLGLFGKFEEISGGEDVSERVAYAEAGSEGVVYLRRRQLISPIVLRRPYDHARDQSLIEWCKDNRAGRAGGLHVQRVVAVKTISRFNFVEDIRLYPNCNCIALAYPDGRSGENAVAYVTVTLSCDS